MTAPLKEDSCELCLVIVSGHFTKWAFDHFILPLPVSISKGSVSQENSRHYYLVFHPWES